MQLLSAGNPATLRLVGLASSQPFGQFNTSAMVGDPNRGGLGAPVAQHAPGRGALHEFPSSRRHLQEALPC